MSECPKPTDHMINSAKDSQYGCVWFSPRGNVAITSTGEYGWHGKKLPIRKEDDIDL